MKQGMMWRRSFRDVVGGIALVWLLLAGSVLLPVQSLAATVYSYIDEQGNPRFSDSLDSIPEQYRAKVKTHEQAAPHERPRTALDNVKAVVSSSAALVQQKVGALLQGFGVTRPSAPAQTGVAASSTGMNMPQSQILNYAGAAAVVLLLMMYFSKGPMIRLLGLCLIIILGVATPVLLYMSDDGPMTNMTGRAVAAGQAQQDRLKQVGP